MSAYPFCCSEAIPISLKHLLGLIPPKTTHNVLEKAHSSAPLLASFLSFIESGSHISTAALPSTKLPFPATFYAIIQVLTQQPSLAIATPPTIPPRVSTVLTPANSISYATNSVRYFAPVEGSGQDTILAPKMPLKNRVWRELKKDEALECLRFPGSGIEIGDGEAWTQMPGMEKLWCERHKLFFEIRAWVRDT